MRRHLRTIVVLLLTGGLLAFFLRSADLGAIWQEMQAGNPGLLLVALVATASLYVVRVWRWQLLLNPIGRVRFSNALRATIIGFGLSALLPARPGEVVRPYVLARREGISATAAFATILLERLLDLVAVLLLFGVCITLFDADLVVTDARVLRAVEAGGTVSAVAALATLGLTFTIAGRPELLDRMLEGVRRLLPGAAGRLVARLTGKFTAGLGVVRQPRGIAGAFALSLTHWIVVAISVWAVAAAYRLPLPPSGALVMLALLVLGVSVPTPGGVGGFHAAFQIGATALYGAPADRAAAAAIVLHAITFVPVAAVSLVLMAREGVSLTSMRRITSPDAAPACDPSEREGSSA